MSSTLNPIAAFCGALATVALVGLVAVYFMNFGKFWPSVYGGILMAVAIMLFISDGVFALVKWFS